MRAAGTVQVPVTETHRWQSPAHYRRLPRRPLNDRARAYLRVLRARTPGPQWERIAAIMVASILLHALAWMNVRDALEARLRPVQLDVLEVRLIEPPPPLPPPPPPPPEPPRRPVQVLEPVQVVLPPPPPPEPPPEPVPEPPPPQPVPEPSQLPPVPVDTPTPSPPVPALEVEVRNALPITPIPVERAESADLPAMPAPLPAAPTVRLQAPATEVRALPKPALQPAPMAPQGLPLPAIPAVPVQRHTIRADIEEGAAPLPEVYNDIGRIVLPEIGIRTPPGGAPAAAAGGFQSPLGSGGDSSIMHHDTPIGYQSTVFEEAWVPADENLLEEAVRKTMVRKSLITLPDGSTIDCVISPLALAGGCGIANPKQLNKQLVVEHKRDNLAPANPLVPRQQPVPAPATSVPASPASVADPAAASSMQPTVKPTDVPEPASQ